MENKKNTYKDRGRRESTEKIVVVVDRFFFCECMCTVDRTYVWIMSNRKMRLKI
jgi:hypothetical protein